MANENAGGIYYEVGADVADLLTGASQANKALDDIGKAADKTSGRLESLDKTSKATGKTIVRSADDASTAAKMLESLGNELAILEERSLAGGRAAAILGAQLRLGTAASDQQKKEVGNLVGRLYDMRNGTDSAVKSAGGFRNALQQGGYQVQDFIVQVQGGQSALVAFSQQGSQLAGAFGPGGAVVGAFLALGSVLAGVLINALGNSKNEMDTLAAAATELNKVVVTNSQGVAALSNDYARLAVTNATLAAQFRDNAIDNYRQKVEESGKAIQSIIKDQKSWFGGLGGGIASVTALGEVMSTLNITADNYADAFAQASKVGLGTNSMASTLTATVSMLSSRFDIGTDSAFTLAKKLNDLAKNPSPEALSTLIDYMKQLNPATKEGAAALLELETSLIKSGVAMQQAKDQVAALTKRMQELRTEAQNSNFSGLSQQLEQERISLTKGALAAKEYAISKMDLTDTQKQELLAITRSNFALDEQKKAQDKAAKASESAANKSATSAAAIAQQLEKLREKSELSASSTGELSRQQTILTAQQSLGKSATQEQINLAGEYAAKAYDNAKALKEQAAAEKQKQDVQKQFQQIQGQANPVTGLDNTYQQQLAAIDQYKTLYPQKIAEAEAARAAIEQQYRDQRMTLMWAEWQQQNMAAQLFGETLDTSLNTVSSSITGLLNGTQSLNEGLANIANTVLSSVVNSFVQMGAEWVKSAIMGQTAQIAATTATTAASVAGTATTTAASTSAAAVTTAAWTPAAIVASIGSFGGAAAIGIGAVIAAMALSGSIAGKRKNGGPVRAGSMYEVGEGGMPEIYQSSTGRSYMIPGNDGSVISNKDMMSGSGTSGGGLVVYNNIQNNSSASVSSSAQQNADGSLTISTFIQDMSEGGPMAQSISANFATQRKATE